MLDYYILLKYSKIGNQESVEHLLCQTAGTTCIYLDLENRLWYITPATGQS